MDPLNSLTVFLNQFSLLFPSGHLMSMTPEQLQAWRWEREIDERNRPLTDEELDAMFPEGYKVCAAFYCIKFSSEKSAS